MAHHQHTDQNTGPAGAHTSSASSTDSSHYDADLYDPRYDNYASHDSSTAGKVVLAALVGAAAGAVVGLLLAPDKGTNTVAALRDSARPYGEQLQSALKKYLDKLEDLGAKAGLMGAGSRLQLKGNWNDLKGQLKQQYADLTDEDLTYAEGATDELVGNVQRRLGKTQREVVELLNNLG